MISSDQRPPGEDWLVRRIVDIERQMRELQAGRRLESATIGAGGIKVRGGEIRIQDPGGTVDLAVLSSDGVTIGGTPLIVPGAVSIFAGPATAVPSGWLVCDGAAVSRTTYANLFTTIGTIWGTGDGSTTFNLPDLRDRWWVGASATIPLGSTGGATTHAHTNPSTGSAGSHAHSNPVTSVAGGHAHANPATGSAGSHAHGTGGPSQNFIAPVGADQNVGSGTHGHTTGTEAAHTHTVGNTGSVADHAHGVGSTGTEAAHTHTQADTGTGSNVPPYAAVLPIIRY